MIKANYEDSITNLACSIRKYFEIDYKRNKSDDRLYNLVSSTFYANKYGKTIKYGINNNNPYIIPDTPNSIINIVISNTMEYEYIIIAAILKTQQNGFIFRNIATMHSIK